jgi:hypothetical protein
MYNSSETEWHTKNGRSEETLLDVEGGRYSFWIFNPLEGGDDMAANNYGGL